MQRPISFGPTLINPKPRNKAIETIREWLETFQCSPKSLCADMAFGAPEFEAFFKEQKIRPLLTGPATPWPNRAEAANILFKQYLAAFLAEVDKDPRLRTLPPKSLIRRAATARNTTVTFGGKTPLELAMGRRPRDIVTVEHQDPENITSTPSQAESDVSKVQKLAMKAYLEARQREDLRRDLTARLMPNDGPFEVGDVVYYWRDDPSKIKAGRKMGVWIKGNCWLQRKYDYD